MISKLYSILDKKTKIHLLLIQIIFIFSTFFEFLNLNLFLAFLISIFSENIQNNSFIFLKLLDFNISDSITTSKLGIMLIIIFLLSSSFILFSNYITFYFSHYLKAKLTEEELKGFCKGNTIKYITRADQKNKKEDLEKAKWYLEKLIQEL